MDGFEADKLIGKSRQLFEVDDYYTVAYVRVIDDCFNEIAPWSRAKSRYGRHYGKDAIRGKFGTRNKKEDRL